MQWVASSPVDADLVVFGRDTGGDERTQLHRVAPTGVGEQALTDEPGVIHRFGGFTPDGRLYLASDAGRDVLAATRITVGTGAWTRFGPDDHDVEEVTVAAGIGALVVNEDGGSRLHWFDPATLALTGHVELPVGVAGDLCIAPGGGALTFTFSGAAQPRGVWRAAAGASHAEPLTRSSTPGGRPRRVRDPDPRAHR